MAFFLLPLLLLLLEIRSSLRFNSGLELTLRCNKHEREKNIWITSPLAHSVGSSSWPIYGRGGRNFWHPIHIPCGVLVKQFHIRQHRRLGAFPLLVSLCVIRLQCQSWSLKHDHKLVRRNPFSSSSLLSIWYDSYPLLPTAILTLYRVTRRLFNAFTLYLTKCRGARLFRILFCPD